MRPRFTLLLFVAFVIAVGGGAGLWLWADDAGRVTRLNAVLNYGLLIGAGTAAAGLFQQIAEARRSREGALRPVLIVVEAWPEPIREDGPARLVVRNIGPGPALAVDVRVWVVGPIEADIGSQEDMLRFIEQEGRDFVEPDSSLGYTWPLSLPAGVEASFPIWRWGEHVAVPQNARLRYEIAYRDVFGNEFKEPAAGAVGHVWVRNPDLEDIEGDYRVRFR